MWTKVIKSQNTTHVLTESENVWCFDDWECKSMNEKLFPSETVFRNSIFSIRKSNVPEFAETTTSRKIVAKYGFKILRFQRLRLRFNCFWKCRSTFKYCVWLRVGPSQKQKNVYNFSTFMSSRRFELLLRFLHLNDSKTMPPPPKQWFVWQVI